jgi:hypothetical protein
MKFASIELLARITQPIAVSPQFAVSNRRRRRASSSGAEHAVKIRGTTSFG